MAPKVDKKAKLYNSRTIRTENGDPNLKAGVLDVPAFIAAREFEIKSMEMSQLKSKYASSTRCFQSLPRLLRRRTASHNVKRIPKRLRNRAIREMQNTTNGVPPVPKHKTGKALYRLKMSSKLLKLASRIKLLRSLPEVTLQLLKLPVRKQIRLLQNQISLIKSNKMDVDSHDAPSYKSTNNTVGSYDNTGVDALAPRPRGSLKYTKRQNQFVWLPTHVWHAKRAHLVKRHGYQIPLRPTQKCYKQSDRSSRRGAIMYDTSYMDCLVLEGADDQAKSDYVSRITKNTSAKVLAGEKLYYGWIYVADKAVGKGCVFCWGNKVLVRVFPSVYEELFEFTKLLLLGTIQDCRYSIGSIELTGPKAVELVTRVFHVDKQNCIAAQNWLKLALFLDSNQTIPAGTTYCFNIDDPRKWDQPSNFSKYHGDYNDLMISVRTASIADRIDPLAMTSLLSADGRQKSYENQKSIKELSKFDHATRQTMEFKVEPFIPVLVTKLETNWCVSLPWFWVLPVWFQLSKATHIQLGGLEQLRQINYENGIPSYPQDFPFLRDGYLENWFNMVQREKKWKIKPSSHKVDYNKLGVEFDNFHGQDWRFLQLLTFGLKWWAENNTSFIPRLVASTQFNDDMERQINSLLDLLQLIRGAKFLDEEKASRGETVDLPIVKSNKELVEELKNSKVSLVDKFPKLPLIQVSLDIEGKGHPEENARIYRFDGKSSLKEAAKVENLIGYVTSASYNLKLGRGSAVGCISGLEPALERVLIRNVGATEPMIAKCRII